MSKQSIEDFYGSEVILYDTTVVDRSHYTFFKMYNFEWRILQNERF